MTLDKLVIRRWFDRHLHVRDGEMLNKVLPCTLAQRATGAVIMGNLDYPYETSTVTNAVAYRDRIMKCLPVGSDFTPCMTLYLTDGITPGEVVLGFNEGAWSAVKLYMADQKGQGGTTGSQHGVKNLLGRYKVFEAMQKHGIPLLGHFEAVEDEVDEFDREIRSVERDLKPLLKAFPQLPVVFEHLTDGRAADFVVETPYYLRATVTAHHLMINRNAMFKGGMNPDQYCRPVAKREEHRQKVRRYVTSGNRRFGAGTDSAPHDVLKKSKPNGCSAGIFTAPAAVELYATVFDEDNALDRLEPFLSTNFLDVYRWAASSETMTLERTPFEIPKKVGYVHVFKGGTTLPWKLVD